MMALARADVEYLKENNEPLLVTGVQSWFSFSFVPALRVLKKWALLMDVKAASVQGIRWQVLNVTVNTLMQVLFAATTMLVLENLGDPEWLLEMNQNYSEWTG